MRAKTLLLFAALPLAAFAQTPEIKLEPGKPAPAITVSEFVKGKEIKDIRKGIYVVEFWATWCGPCRTTIPHLTELAKKHQGKVDFLGVSIWENGDDIPAQVKSFVKEFGDKMDYNVAIDKDGMMATNWMEAALENGIPSAFVVKDGVVQWIGHPMEMDQPLNEVVAGTFDVTAFQAKFRENKVQAQREMAIQTEIAAAQELAATDADAAIEKINKIDIGPDPSMESVRAMVLLDIYAEHKPDALDAYMDKVAANPMLHADLAYFAFSQVETEGNPAIAKRAMQRLTKITDSDNPAFWYYLAHTHAALEQYKEAVASLDKMVSIMKANEEAYGAMPDEFMTEINASRKEWSEKAGG